MREAITQAFDNLRANKLRSVLTMFGILWGVVAVVVLSATGEGFQRGNQAVPFSRSRSPRPRRQLRRLKRCQQRTHVALADPLKPVLNARCFIRT